MAQPVHMRKRPAILALGTAKPPYSASQEAIGEWMAASFADRPAAGRLIRTLFTYSGIETRYGCTPEYLQPPEVSRFAPGRTLEESPTTAERLVIYEREAPPLGTAAARTALDTYAATAGTPVEALPATITHLIVVSCTGFFAPGLDCMIARELGLANHVSRTIIGFMGCSAAFNGLRMASQIVAGDPRARVLVVSVEICSLHIQPGIRRDDLVSASLFADGAAAALVGVPTDTDHHYLQLDRFHTAIKPDTQKEMVWQIGDHGFTLHLSARIPAHLTEVAPTALAQLIGGKRPKFWAIHPGGRAIVDSLQEIFELADADVAASRRILQDFGNMSSATVLFVLARQLQSFAGSRRNTTGVAMAFGPGLTLEIAQLSYIPARPNSVISTAAVEGVVMPMDGVA